jgi:hypothetical protein
MPLSERVFLSLFAYAGVSPATNDCLVRELGRFSSLIYHRESKDALISRSRCVAASEFLRSDAALMIMIDHDISWKEGDLERLARQVLTTRAVVAGAYSKRSFGRGVPVRLSGDAEHRLGEDRLVEAEYLSAGFLGIHRQVLTKMSEQLPLTTEDFWPFFLPMLSDPREFGERPEYLSEDWAFCERARILGMPLYLDLFPTLEHQGTHAYRPVDSQVQLPAAAPITLPGAKPTQGTGS